MTNPQREVDRIRADLQSPEVPVRAQAMDALLRWVRDDPGIHAEAVEIFRGAWRSETSGYLAACAIRGIEQIAGPAEAHAARLALLDHTSPQMVAYAVLGLGRNPDIPKFVELLARRPATEVHTSILSVLGRTKDPAVRGPITEAMRDPGLRPYAIEALAALGDPRSIADIELYVDDRGDAWPVDNHGPMMSVGEVAREAIERLRNPAPLPPQAAGSDLSPWEPQSSRRIAARYWWWAAVPLAAALFTIPWFLFVLVPQVFVGGRGLTPSEVLRLDLLGLTPASIGLVAGLALIVSKRRRTGGPWVLLLLGCAACVLAITPFACEAVNQDLSAVRAGISTEAPSRKPEPARPATIPAMPPKLDVKRPEFPRQP